MRQIWGGGAGWKNHLQYFEFGLQYLVQPLGVNPTYSTFNIRYRSLVSVSSFCLRSQVRSRICVRFPAVGRVSRSTPVFISITWFTRTVSRTPAATAGRPTDRRPRWPCTSAPRTETSTPWRTPVRLSLISRDLLWIALKGIVHPKMKILSSFTHPQVDPNLYECLCSEHKGRYFEECL